jgi:predicted Zn-dependent peptidase
MPTFVPVRAAVLATTLVLLASCSSAALAAKRPKPAAPAPAAASPALSAATFAVERHVLPNGLVVLMHEDHSVPTVTFWQWYRVGSHNERPGITGISHFFEHMMFNGSRNVPPKEYDRILESNGGYSNAFTDRDMTAYYEDIASDRLDVVLRLDSDRMAALSLLPEQMKSEMEVVKEERRLRTDNDLSGMLDEALYATALFASPYRWPVIGWMGDLDRITRDECVDYFRTYYAPNNCILVLVGDFDPKAALAAITQAFGPIPSQPAPAPPIDSEPEQHGERRVEVRYPAQNESFMVGYKAPGAKSADLPVLDVLARILSDGESSRLYRALVEDRQIALSADASIQSQLEPTLFVFHVELQPGHHTNEGLAAMDSVVKRLADEGPSERELTKAQNLLEADFVKGLKTNNGVGEQLGFYEHVMGDYHEMFKELDRYHAVTAADCRRVAKAIFDARRRTIANLVPAAADSSAQVKP